MGLLSGCQYTAPPDDGTETASASVPTSPSRPTATVILEGQIEVNKFSQPLRYTTAEGETWEVIAAEFGLKTETLKAFNATVSLRPGSNLDIRGRDTPQSGAHGSTTLNPYGTLT